MAIIVNPIPPPQFIVQGRVGFDRTTARLVDTSTAWTQTAMSLFGASNPLGPVERRYVHGVPHQNVNQGGVVIPGQGTMRAHHVADHEIQQMVCDYMNGVIGLPALFDRIGALYLTSWIDVIVTPRLLFIWAQWCKALARALPIVTSPIFRLSPARQAAFATTLSETLSSSFANLRVGHGQTDGALGHAIAPRLQRGQYDLFGYFIGWLSGHNFALPTLSAETSLVATSWGQHFVGHLAAPGGGSVIVSNVFIGPGAIPNSIFISEEDPVPPLNRASRPLPQRYPGTSGRGGYILRLTRAVLHIVVIVLLLRILGYKGRELIWPS